MAVFGDKIITDTRNISSFDSRSIGLRAMIGAGWLLAWRMLSRSLGFVSTLVLARLLTPADFGVVALATAMAGTVDGLSQFRLSDVILRRKQDDTALHDVVFTLQFARALITGLVLVAIAVPAAAWLDEPRLKLILYYLAALGIVGGAENVGTIEFQRSLKFRRLVHLLAIPRMLQIAVSITLAVLTHSYWAILIGIGVTRISRLILSYTMHPHRPRISLNAWQEVAGFSFWLWATSLATTVWERVPVFLIGRTLGTTELGVFRVSAEVSLLPLSELVTPASDALLAGLAAVERIGGRTVANALQAAQMLTAVVAPFVIVFSAGAGFVIAALLGSQWSNGQDIIAISTWICLFAPISYVCGNAFIAAGRVRRQFVATCCAAVFQTVAIWLAVRSHDFVWISLAWVASVAVESALFAVALSATDPAPTGGRAGGWGRMVLAGCMAAMAAKFSGVGWLPEAHFHGAHLGFVQALASLVVIGVLVFPTYLVCLFGLWYLFGGPDGPERFLADNGRQLVLYMRSRLKRRDKPTPGPQAPAVTFTKID